MKKPEYLKLSKGMKKLFFSYLKNKYLGKYKDSYLKNLVNAVGKENCHTARGERLYKEYLNRDLSANGHKTDDEKKRFKEYLTDNSTYSDGYIGTLVLHLNRPTRIGERAREYFDGMKIKTEQSYILQENIQNDIQEPYVSQSSSTGTITFKDDGSIYIDSEPVVDSAIQIKSEQIVNATIVPTPELQKEILYHFDKDNQKLYILERLGRFYVIQEQYGLNDSTQWLLKQIQTGIKLIPVE